MDDETAKALTLCGTRHYYLQVNDSDCSMSEICLRPDEDNMLRMFQELNDSQR
jgi:hypothetical protein